MDGCNIKDSTKEDKIIFRAQMQVLYHPEPRYKKKETAILLKSSLQGCHFQGLFSFLPVIKKSSLQCQMKPHLTQYLATLSPQVLNVNRFTFFS